MICPEWQDRLEAYADGELSPSETEAFRAHASHCLECAAAALVLVEAKGALRRAGQRYAAPSDLRARVLAGATAQIAPARVEATAVTPQPRKATILAWPRWAMAAAAALLLAAGLFFFTGRYQRPNSLAEFADLHVATLASANPVEVVSTDRHTVKPWFQGRIPFTFDVPDLQGSPFTL